MQFVSVLTGLGPNWVISHFSIKKKEKKKRNKLHGIIRVVVVLKLSMRGSDLAGL